jgi:farnesyl diphosphate synthase
MSLGAMQATIDIQSAITALASLVDQRFAQILPLPDDPRRLIFEATRYAVMGGGKRMRPLLVVSACDLFHVDRERALRVALAIEAVHCYSLVHDDLPCMDDDDLRRGRPTTHKAFDEASAVLAGDALLTLAFEILAHEATHDDPRVRIDLVMALAKASGLDGMIGGQAMDIAAETTTMDLPTTTRLQQLKTGALIGFCLEAGGIMGKASPDLFVKLRGYAHDVGLAFQIADDLMDISGSEEKAGKKLRKDTSAGKSTFVSLLGVKRAREQARMLIDQAIAHLSVFGTEANMLRAIAHFSIERDH